MSDQQAEHHDDDEQAEAGRQPAQVAAADDHAPDFSRLRLARASLDSAFPPH